MNLSTFSKYAAKRIKLSVRDTNNRKETIEIIGYITSFKETNFVVHQFRVLQDNYQFAEVQVADILAIELL